MDDLQATYLRGLEPQLAALRAAVAAVDGAGEPADSIRAVAHQLKGSGTSFGYPEITDAAAIVLHASDTDLDAAAANLVRVLESTVTASPEDLPTVLVVEDDALLRRLLETILSGPDRHLVLAGTARLAREELATRPAVVLLDLMLPDGDGREILRELRAETATAGIPVVMLSGSDSRPIQEECRALGATSFVTKPFVPDELSRLVLDLLHHPADFVAPVTPVPSVTESRGDQATILLAEDDDLVASLIVDRLERDGYATVHFTDGESALAAARATPPGLAVLDVKMPKMDGFDLLGRWRSDSALATVPVIMLTGMGNERDVVRGFDLGADDYIVKPFSPPELSARVQRLLAHP